jgi:hypothetical protein
VLPCFDDWCLYFCGMGPSMALQTVACSTAALAGLSAVCSPQYHNTWSCKVIPPPRFTKRSVFMELPVTVAFLSGVKCTFSETITSLPQFSQEHPWPLFHTTAKISFINSLVIQPLGWHLTVIPLGSCSFSNVFWFRIMYSGNLIPSAYYHDGYIIYYQMF